MKNPGDPDLVLGDFVDDEKSTTHDSRSQRPARHTQVGLWSTGLRHPLKAAQRIRERLAQKFRLFQTEGFDRVVVDGVAIPTR